MKNNLYTKEQLEDIIRSSYSVSEVLTKLGKHKTGGNRSVLMKYIDRYQIDTSHFTGARWQLNKTSEEIARRKLNTILQKDTNFKSHNLKNRLINNGLKENICEVCGINGVWNNKSITLELHHINGDHYDNRLENLQILCPNCHSQTKNFRASNKNKRKKEDIPEIERNGLKINYCLYCGKEILNYRKEKKYCSRECYLKHCSSLEASTKASKEQLINAIEKYSTLTEISKALNISRPTVKKYLQQYDLLDILKSKYNFRAIPVNQYNSDMTIVKTWPSITDAENALKIYGIEKVCKFKRNSAGGYIWRYA